MLLINNQILKKINLCTLTVIPISPAVVHSELAVVSENREPVVYHSAEFRVDIFRHVFTSSRSVPGPVDEVADNILTSL